MQTGPLDELTTLPVLVAIAAGPDGLHEHTIWERASRQGERERVLGFPGEPNPPGSDAPTVGPWAAGDGGRFAFGTSGPDGPALGLRQPGREVRLVPAPAPIRAHAPTFTPLLHPSCPLPAHTQAPLQAVAEVPFDGEEALATVDNYTGRPSTDDPATTSKWMWK